jgi:hypothetical protein
MGDSNQNLQKHEGRVSNQLIRGLMEPNVPVLAHPQDRRSVQHAQHNAVMERDIMGEV